ncbi:MAG: adenine deaminase [Candidatus Freyarchaeota archaeon]|nr:adenine deaminase [Candidatus Jordarchaeia archaeon]
MGLENVVRAALGEIKADLVLSGGEVINVFTGELERADVAVKGDTIVCVGEIEEHMGKGTKVLDVSGMCLSPGFFDAHVHIESSQVTPTEFARLCLPHGTTSVVWDPHEIANVAGVDGIIEVLQEVRRLPVNFFVVIPSCVPASDPRLGGAGGEIGVREIERLRGEAGVVGLGEMMNFPGVLGLDPGVVARLNAAKGMRVIDGHCPGLSGRELCAYIAAGVRSDHESVSGDEGVEKLRRGMFLMLREGTASKNLSELLKPVVRLRLDMRNCLLACDDISPEDLKEGHINLRIRKSIEEGVDPVRAYQMATLNTATYLGVDGVLGGLAPGRRADMVVLSDIERVKVEMVFAGGILAAEKGKTVVELKRFSYSDKVRGSMHVAQKIEPELFAVRHTRSSATVRVVRVEEGSIVTREEEAELSVVGGVVEPSPADDVLQVAVLERHKGTGEVGLGFVSGFGLSSGSLASTVAHDSHNLVVVGASRMDMAVAARELVRMQGGMVVADRGKILGALPLEVAGLMSIEDASVVIEKRRRLLESAKKLGCKLRDPFMTLSFISLPVIPFIKITEKGLVDVNSQRIVEVIKK